jgi:hypothetical protein
MTRLTKILITGTALLILPLNLAYADGSTSGSNVLNGQIDLQLSSSHLNTSVSNSPGNVANASSAVGNNVEVVTMDNTNVTNSQYVGNVSINADQNANVQNIGGTVSLSSQAACNAADVSTDPHTAAIYSNQTCNASDPSALLNANVANINNDVSLSSQAIGNSFSEDTNAQYMPVQNYQTNSASIASTVNSKVTNVNGNITINSTAVGNNAQIVQY